MKKYIKWLIGAVLIIGFALLWIFDTDYNRYSKKYEKLETEITQVSEYLADLGIKEIEIDRDYDSGEIQARDYSTLGRHFDIKVRNDILTPLSVILDKKHYCIIKEDSAIYYYFGSNLNDHWGILYMCNGELPPQKNNMDTTVLTKQIKDNVYYYCTDWNGSHP